MTTGKGGEDISSAWGPTSACFASDGGQAAALGKVATRPPKLAERAKAEGGSSQTISLSKSPNLKI